MKLFSKRKAPYREIAILEMEDVYIDLKNSRKTV